MNFWMTWRTNRPLPTWDTPSPRAAATAPCRKSVPESSSGTAIRRRQRTCSCKPPSNAPRRWTSRNWSASGQENRGSMQKCASSPGTSRRMPITASAPLSGKRPFPLMNTTFPHFPWTPCRRLYGAMCWRWRNPRRLPWTWRR